MSATRHVTPPSAGALATTPDPNVTEPPETQTFLAPQGSDAKQQDAYVVPADGTTISVRLWAFDPTLSVWFALGATAACAALALTKFADVPTGVNLFAQITSNTGVTQFGVGFMGARV